VIGREAPGNPAELRLVAQAVESPLADIANALRVPVWDIAAFAKALLGA
jgi:hypothetical protein